MRANAPYRRYLGAEGEDRLQLQRAPEQRLGRADPPASPEVLERVEAEPDVEALAGAADRVVRLLDARALLGGLRRDRHETAEPAGSGQAVEHLDPSRVA